MYLHLKMFVSRFLFQMFIYLFWGGVQKERQKIPIRFHPPRAEPDVGPIPQQWDPDPSQNQASDDQQTKPSRTPPGFWFLFFSYVITAFIESKQSILEISRNAWVHIWYSLITSKAWLSICNNSHFVYLLKPQHFSGMQTSIYRGRNLGNPNRISTHASEEWPQPSEKWSTLVYTVCYTTGGANALGSWPAVLYGRIISDPFDQMPPSLFPKYPSLLEEVRKMWATWFGRKGESGRMPGSSSDFWARGKFCLLPGWYKSV